MGAYSVPEQKKLCSDYCLTYNKMYAGLVWSDTKGWRISEGFDTIQEAEKWFDKQPRNCARVFRNDVIIFAK